MDAALIADVESAFEADGTPEDDLERIEGIGPKIGAALRASGITTYAQLADAERTTVEIALEKANLRFAPSIATWSRQARLLADGDEAGFKELTDRLVAGREVTAKPGPEPTVNDPAVDEPVVEKSVVVEPEPEPVAVEPESEPEPVAIEPEPESIAVEPEAVAVELEPVVVGSGSVAAEAGPEAVAIEPESEVAEAGLVAVAVEPEPKPVAVEPEVAEAGREAVAVEPEPVAIEPAPEPVAVAVEPEPVAEAVAVEAESETEPVAGEPEAVAAEAEPEPVVVPAQAVAPAAEAVAPAAEAGRVEDLKRIEGIGPKMSAALVAAGIRTYAQLADADVETLRAAISAAGLRFAPSLVTWARQARHLADGDEEGFADLTRRLVAGRDTGRT
ncbi:helix-hairpin-helix domain-containing protein [Dactylosporangium sp. NPDC000555]|uniref:helix-hairpin-helix domain-containing protein n=1 Tax=Dactylosporangium sp. NPDC000555 TaxID=3154260 RepID=UPI0033229A01